MQIVRRKVVYVQPLQSPYSTPRFAALARDPELEIVVLLEGEHFADRPSWTPANILGCKVEVVGSQLVSEYTTHRDLAYDVTDVRFIPWRLPLALHRHKPDVVVVCNATELFFALVARLFRNFKLALNVEDTRHTVRHLPTVRAYVKQWMYRRADLHLAFSNQSEDYLRSIGIVGSIARTSWSIDIDSFAPDAMKRKAIRSRLGVDDRVVFLFVGRFIPLKGLMPMLRAWACLTPDVRARAALILVGEGPLEDEARQFVQDRGLEEVRFVGRVPYAEMPAYYSASEVFILPTLQDVWGLVVLEAMASGCAVMTSAYCGASYLVKEGENGWLFDSADESSIHASLKRAIEVRNQLPTMGAAARASVQSIDTVGVMDHVAATLKRL